MNTTNFNSKVFLQLGFGIFLICIVIVGTTFLQRPLNIDGGSYLLLAQEISNGSLSGPANGTGYTPLVMWIYSLFLNGSNPVSYQIIVLFNICAIVANSFLLVIFISKEVELSKYFKLVVFSIYLLFQLLLEGTDIILEPWVVLFMIIGLLLVQSGKPTNYLLAGVAIAFSFLSKQYGLASLGVVITYLIFLDKGSQKYLKAILLVLGLSATIYGFWFLFSNTYLPPAASFSNYFNKSNYHGEVSIVTSLYYIGILILFRITFLSYLSFIAVKTLSIKKLISSREGFALASIICFLPAFYNKQYLHYFHFILPFIIVLISSNSLRIVDQIRKSRLNQVIIALTFIISIASLGRSFFKSIYFTQKEQSEIAQKLINEIPTGSKVFIQDSRYIPFYYLCDFKFPKKVFSHDVTKNITDSINQELISKSQYLVLLKEQHVPHFEQILELNEIAPIYKRIQKE